MPRFVESYQSLLDRCGNQRGKAPSSSRSLPFRRFPRCHCTAFLLLCFPAVLLSGSSAWLPCYFPAIQLSSCSALPLFYSTIILLHATFTGSPMYLYPADWAASHCYRSRRVSLAFIASQ
ncbi:hypothetical protein C8Q70DRAFT_106961 [Cubamyces menziesii]|nr:hypothetical protein C8Q70DRAFT_106961 [Cubamyces menziesii]